MLINCMSLCICICVASSMGLLLLLSLSILRIDGRSTERKCSSGLTNKNIYFSFVLVFFLFFILFYYMNRLRYAYRKRQTAQRRCQVLVNELADGQTWTDVLDKWLGYMTRVCRCTSVYMCVCGGSVSQANTWILSGIFSYELN